MGAVNLPSSPGADAPSVGDIHASGDPDNSVILTTAIASRADLIVEDSILLILLQILHSFSIVMASRLRR